MSLQTVIVITDTCVRCGGASGAEVIPGDTVLMWLDQTSVPDFPESVPGVIVIVDPQTPASTGPKHYTIQYDDVDLDGAAALLRDCDVLSVTCESCCKLINDYLDLMAGVNLPQVDLTYSWSDSDSSFTLQAHAWSSQMAGSPSALATIATYVFTDQDAVIIAEDGDPDSRVIGVSGVSYYGWEGGLYTVTVTDSEGLSNSASVWVDPRPGVFPTAANTVASASTITPLAPNFFVSGTAQIDTIVPPGSMAFTGGPIYIIPTGAFTFSTDDNIALAGTAVPGRVLIFIYNATTSTWYPSYT